MIKYVAKPIMKMTKHGVIKPLFKGAPKDNRHRGLHTSNILSGPGRVKDSLIAKQQNNFTEEVNLILREHHGFRSLHSHHKHIAAVPHSFL